MGQIANSFRQKEQPPVRFLFILPSKLLDVFHPSQVSAFKCLRAFSVNNRWARLVVFLFGHPHFLEGGKGSKNGSSNPDRVLSLRRGNDFNVHSLRSKSFHFLFQSFWDSSEHGGSSRHDNVLVQVSSDINVALHDRVESKLVNSCAFHANEVRLEEGFRSTESFASDSDDVTVGEFVLFLQVTAGVSAFQRRVVVLGDKAEFLLDVTDNFFLG